MSKLVPTLRSACFAGLFGALLLVSPACGDDGGGDGDLPDADTQGEADAATADAASPDAAEPDAAVDAWDVSVEGPITDTELRGGAGGTLFEDVCADGEALVGFTGSVSGSYETLGGVCADLVVTEDVVTTGATTALTVRGGQVGNSPFERLCPADHVITGFRGHAGSLIDELTFRCAPMTIAEGAVVFGTAIDLDSAGNAGSDQFEQTDCPEGQLAVQSTLRVGDSIDAFGLGCRTPAIVDLP